MSLAASAAEILNVRFSESPERTRLVFDLSEKVPVDRTQLEQTLEIRIDGLKRVPANLVSRPQSKRFTLKQVTADHRIVLGISSDIQVKSFTVPADPANQKAYRLVVDFSHQSPKPTVIAQAAETEIAPQPALKPISDQQAEQRFEHDIDSIRTAVQGDRIALSEADQLTRRKRESLVVRVAASRNRPGPVTIHRSKANLATVADPMDQQKQALVKSLVQTVQVQAVQIKPVAPTASTPKIVSKPRPAPGQMSMPVITKLEALKPKYLP